MAPSDRRIYRSNAIGAFDLQIPCSDVIQCCVIVAQIIIVRCNGFVVVWWGRAGREVLSIRDDVVVSTYPWWV